MLGSGEKVAMIVAMLVMLVGTGAGVEGRDPVLHRAGGGQNTWEPGVNFTDWSSHEQFYVGDWLCEFLSFFLCLKAVFPFFWSVRKSLQMCCVLSPLSCKSVY